MADLHLPDFFIGVAFNAEPFDPAAVPTWTDLSARCVGIGAAGRGRQYELDQNQTGNMDVTWVNIDEALNPVNTAGPYYPNVQPYRAILPRVMWPNGGTGNLLNLAYNGTDGSFESYTAAAAAPSWLAAVGAVVATVSTTTPQQGTKDISYAVVGGATVQGLSWVVPCIPGRQYTASGYVRQSTASTQRISIVGGAVGSSTATAGAYVRLSVTFTATQPTHTVQLATTGAAVAGAVLIDALQHEPGAAATTFTTTGPLIRNIWTRGYVERWPVQWDETGFEGRSTTPCVGPFAILQNADLRTAYSSAVLSLTPAYYWTLQEPAASPTFTESSGNSGPPLLLTTSPSGAGGTFAPATTMGLAGDPSGTGVRTSPASGNEGSLNVPFQCLQLGYLPSSPKLVGPSAAAGSSTTWSCTSAWIMSKPAANINGGVNYIRFTTVTNQTVTGLLGSGVGTLLIPGTTADVWGDGRPHLWVNTVTLTPAGGGTLTSTYYVDGVMVGTSSTPGFGSISRDALVVNVGGAVTYTFNQGWQDQTISHLAYWNRALSAGEIATLASASTGYAGELESTRIARYLALGGYTGPTAIGAGASVMGASTVRQGDAVLAASLQASDSAFGNFYESADGIAYASRNTRYLTTAASYVFGENVAGGEYPYIGNILFDFDPQLVLNVADVTRTGGIVAHAEDTTGFSQKRFGRKNFTRTVDIASDNEAVDAATWVVSNRKAPLMRVASVTFDPAATRVPFGDGTLWPMLLTLEIGTRVTVKRRPKSANAGAGITMSGDYYVEKIDHSGINFETGTWLVTLQLSPVNTAQPWILQDAVYGQLDVTTVLGF